jgi:hypothetical protein
VYCHGIEARPGMGTADAPGDWAEPAVRVLERVNDYELSRDGGWRQAARIVELALEAAYEAGRRADT